MTAPHNPFAGETPFPEAGEGVVLKFTTSDIARLHSMYGPDVRRPPEIDPVSGKVRNSFWQTVIGHISVHDPVVIEAVLRVGLKEPNAEGKLKPIRRADDWWEEPPFRYSDVADQIESGLMWSRWGLTPDQLAEKIREQIEAERRAAAEGTFVADPTIRTMESPTSSESSSGPTSTD
jgi:hypothetical protein